MRRMVQEKATAVTPVGAMCLNGRGSVKKRDDAACLKAADWLMSVQLAPGGGEEVSIGDTWLHSRSTGYL